jgi:electron transport complex protein RnfG
MLVCLVASSVLAFTYKITNPLIISRKQNEEKQALKSVLSSAEDFKEEKGHYTGYKNKRLSGYVLKIQAKGYSAPIEILVGIDSKGIIQGIIILDQKETPGLGAKISEIKYGEKNPWFLNQFKGKQTVDLDFLKINAITGATISSYAVLSAVKNKITEFMKHISD